MDREWQLFIGGAVSGFLVTNLIWYIAMLIREVRR